MTQTKGKASDLKKKNFEFNDIDPEKYEAHTKGSFGASGHSLRQIDIQRQSSYLFDMN
jgi:hypothetical protein